MHHPTTGFKVASKDADILNEYMDEFENANTQTRNNILEKVMGELYKLQPSNPTCGDSLLSEPRGHEELA